MNILILGGGGREHAYAFSLVRSPSVHKVYVCPGNGGMKEICTCIPFTSNSELVSFSKSNVDLAVVGSSEFIARGTVDSLLIAGIPVLGPAADAGRIETSKAYATAFMVRHRIPSPLSQIVSNLKEAEEFIRQNQWVRVVKCDRFSFGSGVAITQNDDETLAAVKQFLKAHGPPLILQERLTGMECSYSILTDGNQWVSFSTSRDYKHAIDHEEGPTTGGMGSVSPCPGIVTDIEQRIRECVVEPTVSGLAADKLSYKGFLSLQLMLTTQGPRVVEFNARLGDPETQSILARFRGDLASLLMDCAQGRLDSTGSEVAFGKHRAVSVVLARKGYPNEESCDPKIENIDTIKNSTAFFSGADWLASEKRWRFKTFPKLDLEAILGCNPEFLLYL
ncbi:phosphoribosylamine--glycine ligase [bacterium]|nr:phosphoribosylamine--glycine ligase [bacterium]